MGIELTAIDVDDLKSLIEDRLEELPEVEIDIEDDEADHGVVNVGFYNPVYVTNYDMVVDSKTSVSVSVKGRKLKTLRSIVDAADFMTEHFVENYV